MTARAVLSTVTVIALTAHALAQSSAPAAQPAAQPDTQLDQAQEVVARGERISGRVAAMMTQAQREKDIIRVNCLDDKLAQVNANVRTAKARVEALRGQADPTVRGQSMTVMMVLGQKFDVLEQEASQCVGQNIYETGATMLETQVDPKRVPTDAQAGVNTVPDLVPAADPGYMVTELPPPPQEASGKS